eukprot:442279_1
MTEIVSFSFLSYTKSIHEWKYSASTYYKHILYLYLKQYPTARAKSARLAINNVITSYVNGIIEAARLDNIWTESTWNSVVSQVKTNIKNHIHLTRNTHVYEHQKKGAEQLKYLFEHYGEKEWILLLNRYSKDYICSNDDKKFDLKYEQCERIYICGPWKYHTFKLKVTITDSEHRKVTQMKALKNFMMYFYELQQATNLQRLGIRVIVIQQNIDNDNDQQMEDMNIQEELMNVDNSANASPLEEININVQFHGIRGTSYEHNQTNPY